MLRKVGLITDAPVQVHRGTDLRKPEAGPFLVERFQWRDGSAANLAHQTPEVMAVWETMGPHLEDMTLITLEPIAYPARIQILTLDAKAKLDALEAVCAAIAHPARRQILLTVHLRGAMTAGDIAGGSRTRGRRRRGTCACSSTRGCSRRCGKAAPDHARLALLKEWLGWFDKPPPG